MLKYRKRRLTEKVGLEIIKKRQQSRIGFRAVQVRAYKIKIHRPTERNIRYRKKEN